MYRDGYPEIQGYCVDGYPDIQGYCIHGYPDIQGYCIEMDTLKYKGIV